MSNPAQSQLRRVYGKKGANLIVLANLKDAGGLLATAATVTIKQDFSPYDTLVTANAIDADLGGGTVGVSLQSPPRGTATNVDDRWDLSSHNNEGYNFQITIPAAVLSAIGKYRMEVSHSTLVTVYEIHIGS